MIRSGKQAVSSLLILCFSTIYSAADIAFAASAAPAPRDGLFDGATLAPIQLNDVVNQVEAGGVLVLGELHGNQIHHQRQREAIAALAASGRCTVSVGLEFLSWPSQQIVDEYFDGRLSEPEFLKQVGWGSDPFDNYREQALFPRNSGGRLLALNAPRSLTSSIAKNGIEGLTPEELKLMPPDFQLGSKHYLKRFEAVMGGHVPAAALKKYFAAQSTWDDSMAWTAAEFLSANPTHCLAIIVGDFHAQFGGGLPDRLKARGVKSVVTISQFDSFALTDAEVAAELGPHLNYGSRGEAVWISQDASGSVKKVHPVLSNFGPISAQSQF